MCLNASAAFRHVPVGKAACEEMMPGSVIPQTILGCDTAVTSGWNCPRPPCLLPSKGFYPCYKFCASLWIALCSLWLGVNHNRMEKAPNAIQATSWAREKKKKTQLLAFHQNITLLALAIIRKDLETRSTWSLKSNRGQSPHSEHDLSVSL